MISKKEKKRFQSSQRLTDETVTFSGYLSLVRSQTGVALAGGGGNNGSSECARPADAY
jgi:hypothetical protein